MLKTCRLAIPSGSSLVALRRRRGGGNREQKTDWQGKIGKTTLANSFEIEGHPKKSPIHTTHPIACLTPAMWLATRSSSARELGVSNV